MEDLLQEDNNSLSTENQEENISTIENSSNLDGQDRVELNSEKTDSKECEENKEPCESFLFEECENCENKSLEGKDTADNNFSNGEEKVKKEGPLSLIVTILLAVLCVSLVFVKFVWLYCVVVEGDSMNATLQTGDYLLVDRLAEVERGDVIVFTLEEKSYIKRVVALEGDTVRISNGNLYVKKAGESNFEIVEYEGVLGKTYYNSANHGKIFEQVISQDHVFALGDNREHSTDSRILGEIGLDKIDGVVHQFIIDKKDGSLGKLYKYV